MNIPLPAPHRIQVKIYTEVGQFDTKLLIEQFHSWIQKDLIEEVAIDVADYSHVVNGPGILLITHEADYAFDEVGGLGLRYVRKKELPDSLQLAILQSIEQLITAAYRLENETDATVVFKPDMVDIALLDRRLYPNEGKTLEGVQGALSSLLTSVFGSNATLQCLSDDTRYPFTLRITASDVYSLRQVLDAVKSVSLLNSILAA